MLILECSQGCCAVKIWPGDIDLWPWKSIGFQILVRTKYVPSLVKIHWRILILVFIRMLCGKNLTQWTWPLTLKINRVPDSRKDYIFFKLPFATLKHLQYFCQLIIIFRLLILTFFLMIVTIPTTFRLFHVLTSEMLGRWLPVFMLLLWQRQHIIVVNAVDYK